MSREQVGPGAARSPLEKAPCSSYPHGYDDVVEKDGKYFGKATGVPMKTQIEKMSKSRFNVVSPDDVVRDYGADSLRLYELFMGPLVDSQDVGTP